MTLSRHFQTWCVVSSDGGYSVESVPLSALSAERVLAVHPSEESALRGLQRLNLAIPMFREKFEESIQHEIELRNRMIEWLRKTAEPKDDEA